MTWADFLKAGEEAAARGFEPHMADPDEATNILFSSGTTGVRPDCGPRVPRGPSAASDGYGRRQTCFRDA